MGIGDGDEGMRVNAMNQVLGFLQLALIDDGINHIDIGPSIKTLGLDEGDPALDLAVNGCSNLFGFLADNDETLAAVASIADQINNPRSDGHLQHGVEDNPEVLGDNDG